MVSCQDFIKDFASGYIILLAYFAICASGALVLRRFIKVPKEVFRKILHMILLGSSFVLVYAFKTWLYSATAAILFMGMVFPLLSFAEKIPGYSGLLVERKKGEIKRSLIVVFFMLALLIWICIGIIGQRYLVIASVYAWGLGDAAAALIGKRFGKHFIEGKLVEGRKTVEGTAGMFVVAFFCVFVILIIKGSLPL